VKTSPREPACASEPPDLQTQLESLLHQVWMSEADWRFDDRIELQVHRQGRDPHLPAA
jgi:hypothetical protein